MDEMTKHRKRRLRALIDAAPYNGSQLEFSRAANLSEGRISQLLDSRLAFGERSARKIELELRLPDRYFETGFDDRGPLDDEEEEFVQVRRADVKFSNGTGQIVYHVEDKPPLSFRADFLRKLGIPAGRAVVVEAVGNSNEDKIRDGAVVLVNTSDNSNLNGRFFAFRVDGELLIKRLTKMPGVGVVATAENSNFSPKVKIYAEAEELDFEVLGHAVWTGTLL
ncbi:LexA family transcriptional regulator [Variovorax paradoxus]|uniref:S24 family peptidase n=1 Tax=Variovorax paradoxus TaxID=34073 RepID=UPI0019319628|nr:LexA family transcriptional regulator [Variovorax paradoxus]